MPRLLNISTYHYRRGGADAVYLDHGALFERAGWQSGWFAMHHPRNAETPWSRFFVDEIELGHDYSLARAWLREWITCLAIASLRHAE